MNWVAAWWVFFVASCKAWVKNIFEWQDLWKSFCTETETEIETETETETETDEVNSEIVLPFIGLLKQVKQKC